MNKILKRNLLFMCLALTNSALSAPAHTITFFVEPYPNITEQKNTEYNKGIFFTYFGYKTISNNDGQVTFPLKTQKPSFYMLVTTQSKPVFMLYNTIAHWQINSGGKYSFFSIERKYDNQTKLYFWNVEQLALPKDSEIPLNTVIVHADPENIFVPTDVSITTDSPQFVLPKIYVKSEVKLSLNALKFLEHCEFFAPIDRTFKIDKTTQESKV